MTLEGIILLLRKTYIRSTAAIRKRKIKYSDFTIISNNCWGGLVYESYGLEKQSPTVGLYFSADDYVRFVSNLEYYICHCKLEFVEPENAKNKNLYQQDKRFGTFPIGRVGDVEMAMLHYHSQEEAMAKWERRCKRVNWDRLLVKMNDQNGCTEEHAKLFGQLPYKHKYFFTVNDWNAGDCTVRIPAAGKPFITAIQEPYGASRYLDINHIINRM